MEKNSNIKQKILPDAEDDTKLFKIGEVADALGLTRRILINYEDLGLVTPTVRNEGKGFRYYSADNVVHIRLIRALQNLGLSLPEIRSYIEDNEHLDDQIDHMILLRDQLDRYIAQLRFRQASASKFEVISTTLPGFTAFCRDFESADVAEKATQLRQTYVDALKHYPVDSINKMCTQIPIQPACLIGHGDQNAANGESGCSGEPIKESGTFIIPVTPTCTGPDIRQFPSVAAICIYYRGPYENFPEIHEQLSEYAQSHDLTPQGFFRNIYMEGPPTHGANKDAYITQVAMPIKFASV